MGMFDEPRLGVPSISGKTLRRGVKIEGVILPQRDGDALVAYAESQDTNDDGTPKVYKNGNPKMTGRILLQTQLTNWDYASADFIERAASDFPDEKDAGLRRYFIGSKYANDAVREAYKRLKAKPEVGGKFTLEVTGQSKGTAGNGDSYTYPTIVINWTAPDASGKKIADDYAATLAQPETTNTPSAFADDEPPF